MNSPNGWEGPPTPEQLAAYADGELEGREQLVPLKRRVEAWLTGHPEAAAEVEACRSIRRLCDYTAPREPDEAAWRGVLARLPAAPPAGLFPKTRFPFAWVAAILLGSAAALAIYFLSGGDDHRDSPQAQGPVLPVKSNDDAKSGPPLLDEGQPFVVATGDEIEILRVEGHDLKTLAVTDPGLRNLELLGRGEVTLTTPRPARGVSVEGSERPMIWARLESEMSDDD